ncbi:MAG: orotidine-5'-phosphate decarboxylase [Candidatus Glassbacteria bacterium]|nr:orotidine-5'-phosphate decarboxylase [Candidatus Glassbacteria bacterium]
MAKLQEKNASRLCVGLDADPRKFPGKLKDRNDLVYEFNRDVIDATLDLVCAYKPNAAFYEALGEQGTVALRKTIEYIAGRVPVILDVKRGDIGNTAARYAAAVFEDMNADAVTLNPYMGFDAVEPFMACEGKGIFLLCLTSNEGSRDFQLYPDGDQLYARVARKAVEWDDGAGRLGLVVGATHPETVGEVRSLAGNLPFLLPGIGAQGGAIESVAAAEVEGDGPGVVVNSSRGVIYAGEGEGWAEDVRRSALELKYMIGVR